MPLPALFGAVAGGIGIGKKILGAGKKAVSAIKGRPKPPTPAPESATARTGGKRRLPAVVRRGLAALEERGLPPTPLSQFAGTKPAAVQELAASAAQDSGLQPQKPGEAMKLLVPVLLVLAAVWFFLLRKR